MRELTAVQVKALQERYSDLINYEDDDPEAPIDPLSYRDSGGDSLLHIAAWRGDDETVSLLLEAGIDPDLRGDMGCTALHEAVCNGHKETVAILISHGVSVDVVNEFGNAPDLSGFLASDMSPALG